MKRTGILLASALIALTGCGGTGSDAVDAAAALITSDRLPITETTAVETAGAVVKSMDGAFDATGSALDFGGAVGARIDADKAAAAVALDVAMRVRDTVAFVSPNTAVGAVITESRDCSDSGTVTMSIDTGDLSEQEFADELQAGQIPSGTVITSTFDECVDFGEGPLNGTVAIEILELSLTGEMGLDSFTMEFDATFDDFGMEDVRIDGDISLFLTSDAGSIAAEISGDFLEVTSSGESFSLVEYLMTFTENNVGLTETFDFTLDTDLGNLLIETLEGWYSALGAENPMSGSLRITGAEDASITIIVLDEVNVQLDVDTDGDGETDVVIMTTWEELDD
jgi:hypothetical protein